MRNLIKLILTKQWIKDLSFEPISRNYCDTKAKLVDTLEEKKVRKPTKVTIIGVGTAGICCAYDIMSKRLCSEICLIDVDEKKLLGEVMDLQHGLRYFQNIKILYGSDYSLSKNSNLCIIAVGDKYKDRGDLAECTKRNVKKVKEIVPIVAQHSPNTIFLVVSRPVDILTWATWKVSGFPHTQVLGTGTGIDSACFRFLLAEKLDVAPNDVHGYIIGQHGSRSIPIWSTVNVTGVPFARVRPTFADPDDTENWHSIHAKVIQNMNELVKLKGDPSCSIAAYVREVWSSIYSNAGIILAVSLMIKGYYGIKEECYMSLPAVLNSNGVRQVVKLQLKQHEIEALQKSASEMAEKQKATGL